MNDPGLILLSGRRHPATQPPQPGDGPGLLQRLGRGTTLAFAATVALGLALVVLISSQGFSAGVSTTNLGSGQFLDLGIGPTGELRTGGADDTATVADTIDGAGPGSSAPQLTALPGAALDAGDGDSGQSAARAPDGSSATSPGGGTQVGRGGETPGPGGPAEPPTTPGTDGPGTPPEQPPSGGGPDAPGETPDEPSVPVGGGETPDEPSVPVDEGETPDEPTVPVDEGEEPEEPTVPVDDGDDGEGSGAPGPPAGVPGPPAGVPGPPVDPGPPATVPGRARGHSK